MKEMIKKMREEKDGFTIAELLIVVAIVAVLVAIAIPVFTSSLGNAQAGTNQANVRSYYGELQSDFLSKGYDANKAVTDSDTITYQDGTVYTLTGGDKYSVKGDSEHGYPVTFTSQLDSTKDKVFGYQAPAQDGGE